jgi:hypothetical protein
MPIFTSSAAVAGNEHIATALATATAAFKKWDLGMFSSRSNFEQ